VNDRATSAAAANSVFMHSAQVHGNFDSAEVAIDIFALYLSEHSWGIALGGLCFDILRQLTE
jgi:hypothetical protein